MDPNSLTQVLFALAPQFYLQQGKKIANNIKLIEEFVLEYIYSCMS